MRSLGSVYYDQDSKWKFVHYPDHGGGLLIGNGINFDSPITDAHYEANNSFIIDMLRAVGNHLSISLGGLADIYHNDFGRFIAEVDSLLEDGSFDNKKPYVKEYIQQYVKAAKNVVLENLPKVDRRSHLDIQTSPLEDNVYHQDFSYPCVA
ncbi:hypothetical protein PN36_25190 [Candidatus Thiomargarita nelsonii]|uniref:Uncharacterized protein n=1 Tax=Candidatus Thiomargarita nelsonii TaxID=1003181 RepID=A0A4E0QT61_9GAMM|nr:hypothetical protein PN36_25190 [Candidatus Thiomargarita nelsonii]